MSFDGYGYYDYEESFKQVYRCYPASFIEKPQIESGDKIIMPLSALDQLTSLRIDYPMLFELRNDAANRVSHCGVLEFVAEEGTIYMPDWMMENMLLQQGDIVQVKNLSLPKGNYVKLQPHTTDFLDLSNPKAVLEITLRNYSCLTTGDSIMVAYNNKKYYIDVLETKPSNAISIIETDCEVDFAPALDYEEPDEKPAAPVSSEETPAAEIEPKFKAFTGVGRRVDGKPAKEEHPRVSASSSTSDNKQPAAVATSGGHGQRAAGSSSQSTNRPQSQGKLVFGSNTNRVAKESELQEPQKVEEPKKFQAFTGKKYSLKD